MIITNPKGNQAFNSDEFVYAYIKKWDLDTVTLLQVVLKNETELWWDSSPGHCIYAEKDMIDSLAKLTAQMAGVVVSPDKRKAFNVKEFSSARVSDCKETYTTQLIIRLRSEVKILWTDCPYETEDSEIEMQQVLSALAAELNLKG